MVSSIDRTKRDRYSAKGQEINKRVKERKRKREREREREIYICMYGKINQTNSQLTSQPTDKQKGKIRHTTFLVGQHIEEIGEDSTYKRTRVQQKKTMVGGTTHTRTHSGR